MEALVILRRTPDYVALVKSPGQECEHQLPALLRAQLGGTDYFCVHRLDRAVGGVMVYACTRAAAAALTAQIQSRTFQKEYLAVVAGCPAPRCGRMEDYLYKDAAKGRAYPVKRPRRGVKQAVLDYETVQSVSDMALVRVTLHTGRFHQIRVQFASRKMPLLGDGKYGSREKRCTVALFSSRIAFSDPATGAPVVVSARPEPVFPWSAFAWLNPDS